MKIGMMMAVLAIGSIGVLETGCLKQKSAAEQAVDAEATASCVMSNWGKTVTEVATACTGGLENVAEDLIADVEAIFASGKTGAASPYAAHPKIQAKLAAKRVK